jgi:hypothetical protein
MFHKLYLAGASPPRLPGAGPGHTKHQHKTDPASETLKENRHGY